MNRIGIRFCARLTGMLAAPTLAIALLLPLAPSLAQQDSSNGFFGNLFNRGQTQQSQQQPPAPPSQVAQGTSGGGNDVDSRIDQIENALRQLTGTVEDLQHQNQTLQMQLKRLQDDTEYRFQQMGARGTAPMAPAVPPSGNGAPPAAPGQHSDAFNPAQHPDAPGVPHALGNPSAAAVVPQQPTMGQTQGAAAPGAPLDLSSPAGGSPPANANPMAMGGVPQAMPAPAVPPSQPQQQAALPPPQGSSLPPPQLPPPQNSKLPPPPPRNTSATGVQLATLPPSSSPEDEYQLAYGYVLHKDYGLAVQAFHDFMRKYPHEKLLPDAQYWLGESQFRQKHYREAAEAFLAVSTNYEHSGRAPKALLRLGQSLAAMHQKEAACAALAEVGRKYPHSAGSLKHNVAQEQKRAHC
jgi:tol-pal system protein YbgF